MFELYGVKNKNAQFGSFGTWTLNKGFQIPVIEKCVRRQNLNGITLSSVVLENIHFMIYDHKLPHQWTGSLVEIVGILEKKLNFSVKFERPPDGLWGNMVDAKGNQWNGIVQVLMENLADLSCAGLMFSPERSQVIQLGTELIISDMSIVTKELPTSQNIDLMAFLKIFHIYSWLAYFASIIVLAISMTMVHYIFQRRHNICQNMGALYSYSLQRGDFKTVPVSGALTFKVLTISALFMLFVLYNFYTAFLTSLMSSKAEQGKMNTFQDLLVQEYKLVTIQSSALDSILKTTAKKHPHLSILVEQMDSERDYLKSNNEVQERLLNSKSASIASKEVSRTMGGAFQFHTELSKHFPLHSSGFGYPLDSEFAGCFNYHLNKLKESGVLMHTIDKWATKMNGEVQERVEWELESPFPIDIKNVAFVVLILVIGCGTSIVLCLVEICVARFPVWLK